MLRQFKNFVLYNNAFIFVVGFLVLGGGTVLAANEDLREEVVESFVSSDTSVTSVDNSYIINVDLQEFEPTVVITEIADDGEYYYVSYILSTINLYEGVWQEVDLEEELIVEMARVEGQDLGLYLSEEFAELTAAKLAFLREAQEIEQEIGQQEKVETTEYSGLIGMFMGASDETFDGFDPVADEEEEVAQVPEVQKEEEAQVEGVADQDNEPVDGTSEEEENVVEVDDVLATSAATTTQEEVVDDTASTTPVVVIDEVAPVITVLGDASLLLTTDDTYEEFGAEAEDETDGDLTGQIDIADNLEVAVEGVYEVVYTVSDAAGNSAEAIRVVTVEAAPVAVVTASSTDPQ